MKGIIALLLVLAIVAPTAQAGFFANLGHGIGSAFDTAFRAGTSAIAVAARTVFNVHKAVWTTAWRGVSAVARGAVKSVAFVGRTTRNVFSNTLFHSHRHGMFGRVHGAQARLAAATKLAALQARAKVHWRHQRDRMNSIMVRFGSSVHRRSILSRFGSFAKFSMERLAKRVKSFSKCRGPVCRYFYSHSVQRLNRELRYGRRLAQCAKYSSERAARCAKRARHDYLLWTHPGRKWALKRRFARFVEALGRFSKLGRRVRSEGVSPRSNKHFALVWAMLRRHRADLMRRDRACPDAKCKKFARHGLRRSRREFRFLRRMRRCAKVQSKSTRADCVHQVMKALRKTRPRHMKRDESHLPVEERRRRRHERHHLARLHRRARRCQEHQVACTKKFHQRIRSYMRKIISRRRRWERLHAASHKARMSWASLRRMVKNMRSRLHQCNGRSGCVKRILNRLVLRTKRSISHFHAAIRTCAGKECRRLAHRYRRSLNLFLNRLQRRLLHAQERSFSRRLRLRGERRRRRRARKAAARRRARRAARKMRARKLRLHVVVHHHRGSVRRSIISRGSNRLTARLALHRRKMRRCKRRSTLRKRRRCRRKQRRSLKRFLRRVRKHLRRRSAKCTTKACRRRIRTALKNLRRLQRRALRVKSRRGRKSCRKSVRRLMKKLAQRVRRYGRAISKCQNNVDCHQRQLHSLRRRFHGAHRRLRKWRRSRRCKGRATRARALLRRWLRHVRAGHARRLAAVHATLNANRHAYSAAGLFAVGSSSSTTSAAQSTTAAATTTSATTAPSISFDSSLSTPDLAHHLYRRMVLRLSRCESGPAGRACRQEVLDSFRRVLHGRERALNKLHKARAHARLARGLINCDRTTIGNSDAHKQCDERTMRVYADTMQSLHERLLEINKRDNIRTCEMHSTGSLTSECVTKARAEYKDKVSDARARSIDRARKAMAYLMANRKQIVESARANPLSSSLAERDEVPVSMTVQKAAEMLRFFESNGSDAATIAAARERLRVLKAQEQAAAVPVVVNEFVPMDGVAV